MNEAVSASLQAIGLSNQTEYQVLIKKKLTFFTGFVLFIFWFQILTSIFGLVIWTFFMFSSTQPTAIDLLYYCASCLFTIAIGISTIVFRPPPEITIKSVSGSASGHTVKN